MEIDAIVNDTLKVVAPPLLSVPPPNVYLSSTSTEHKQRDLVLAKRAARSAEATMTLNPTLIMIDAKSLVVRQSYEPLPLFVSAGVLRRSSSTCRFVES